MSFEVGKRLYRYTIRDYKFLRHDGTVHAHGNYYFVAFDDGSKNARCPRESDIGVIRNTGPSLWLENDDDELAMHIYLGHEMCRVAALEKQVETKRKVIDMLSKLIKEF